MEYLLIEIFLFAAFFFINRLNKLKHFKSVKHGVCTYIAVYIIGVIWESFAIAREHWIFSESAIINIFIGNVPIEDHIFMFLVVYIVLTTYKLFQKKFK